MIDLALVLASVQPRHVGDLELVDAEPGLHEGLHHGDLHTPETVLSLLTGSGIMTCTRGSEENTSPPTVSTDMSRVLAQAEIFCRKIVRKIGVLS